MKCASALSTRRDTDAALRDVLDRVAEGLEGEPADLAVAFTSAHHADALGRLAREVRARGLARHALGCTGESIIGEGREVEDDVAISLWAIQLPQADLRPIRLEFDGTAILGWPDDLGPAPEDSPRTLILLGEPFSFPADVWLRQPEATGLRIVGGMASAARAPRQNRLVLDDRVHNDGAVGLLIDGPVTIRTIVSQGCRPIGRPMIITRADRNIIKELGRRPALAVLQEMFEALDPEEQELVREGLHVGRVINEYQEAFGRGDFLVRNVLGVDDEGGLAITDPVRVGQTVQFHVRDAATADEDLRTLLAEPLGALPAGALLFSCNGRGTRLFPSLHHDVGALHAAFGPIPVAGLFAMGELGPVGGRNFLHGFTASIVMFCH
ncbi:MAG: FIST C-terminal domain-containing protein [Isosphaeraceae bacterium]|nr:FIST C-terminal domain-containing protein [Isosphaeraceae bacterium]